MSYETVILQRDGKVAVITLNRPEKLNAITMGMFGELIKALDEVSRDDATTVVVLTGAGRAFSAGLALEEMTKLAGLKGDSKDAEEIREIFHHGPRVVSKLLNEIEKPTIAMVNGVAIAVACDLTLACDMRTGSENTRFLQTQVSLGLIPGGGGTWIMPRLLGLGKAAELILTGDPVDGPEAHRIGLLNQLYPAAQLTPKTMELAHRIAAKPAAALRLATINMRRGLNMDMETALTMIAASEGITAASKDFKKAYADYLATRKK